MTQYLMSVLLDTDRLEADGIAADGLASAAESAAIDVFNERLRAGGHWVFAGGLAAPGTATVVDGRGEEPILTDGPYVESKEHIIGFWVVEAADLDVALKLAAQGSKACNRRVELRPFLAG